MPAAKPSLDLLRSLTEEHVLRALVAERRLTRAEIATRTGLSRPTISEGVGRLVEAGLVVDTGERTTGRGRSGSYYALAPDSGATLAVSIGPAGIVAESLDVYGALVARSEEPLAGGAAHEQAPVVLARVCAAVRDATPATLRTAAVSAAEPVDRASGRLVHLPDAPFLVGDLDPPTVLSPYVEGPVTVDNDVNWAARAERSQGAGRDVDDFVYLHLGVGLGCAVVSGGEVARGHSGIAGEIAHLVTTAPDGRAARLTEVFAALDLRLPGSTAIDVDRMRAALGSADTAHHLARATAGAVSAAVALADPELVVVGGPWGTDEIFLAALRAEVAGSPRPVDVVPCALLDDPDLTGARAAAIDQLRDAVLASTRRHG